MKYCSLYLIRSMSQIRLYNDSKSPFGGHKSDKLLITSLLNIINVFLKLVSPFSTTRFIISLYNTSCKHYLMHGPERVAKLCRITRTNVHLCGCLVFAILFLW